MANNHINECIWYDAKRYIPDTNRPVVVVYKRFKGTGSRAMTKHIAEAKFESSQFRWNVDSKQFQPSVDIVTQWCEIESERGGIMPEDFLIYDGYTAISNK